MKVVLINFSGNVGKSTLAANLLASRMHNPQKFEVETLNTGGDPEAQKIKGSRFDVLISSVMKADDAIVDVGASNVEDFVALMQQHEDSHEEFDYFIVPVVKEKKQQADTMNTVDALFNAGIPKEKIRVIFNKVELDESAENEFSAIVGFGMATDKAVIHKDALVFQNEVYELLREENMALHDILNDPTDYRTKLRTATDEDEKNYCVKRVGMKRLGATAKKNLDHVYDLVFA